MKITAAAVILCVLLSLTVAFVPFALAQGLPLVTAVLPLAFLLVGMLAGHLRARR